MYSMVCETSNISNLNADPEQVVLHIDKSYFNMLQSKTIANFLF